MPGSFLSRASYGTRLLDYQDLVSCLHEVIEPARNLKEAVVEKERQVGTLLDITLPRIKNTKTQGNYASYDIEPLEAGYGMTLGNALRRVLLSSLPGAAVTSVQIEGVQHEFQDIPNVMEDVTDIVLNIKQLRLRSFSAPSRLHAT